MAVEAKAIREELPTRKVLDRQCDRDRPLLDSLQMSGQVKQEMLGIEEATGVEVRVEVEASHLVQ